VWDSSLAAEIVAHPSVLGGFIFEWQDEWWKSVGTQDFCQIPSPENLVSNNTADMFFDGPYALGGSAGCTYKAHITCGPLTYPVDLYTQDVCGYALGSPPDGYVNEAWFGFHSVEACQGAFLTNNATGVLHHHLTALTPRMALDSVAAVYQGAGNMRTMPTCAEMLPCWQCVTSQSAEEVNSGACNSQCSLQLSGSASPVLNSTNSTFASVAANFTAVVSSGSSFPPNPLPPVVPSNTDTVSSGSSTGGSTHTVGALSSSAPAVTADMAAGASLLALMLVAVLATQQV